MQSGEEGGGLMHQRHMRVMQTFFTVLSLCQSHEAALNGSISELRRIKWANELRTDQILTESEQL